MGTMFLWIGAAAVVALAVASLAVRYLVDAKKRGPMRKFPRHDLWNDFTRP